MKAAEGRNEHTCTAVPQATILGTYLSEIGQSYGDDRKWPNVSRCGLMIGSGAIACGGFGSGRGAMPISSPVRNKEFSVGFWPTSRVL